PALSDTTKIFCKFWRICRNFQKKLDTKMNWMDRALTLAQEAANKGEVPVGAVLVLDGRIVGEGCNQRETQHDPLGHAELIAIAGAARSLESWRLLNCELYVTLEPCPMCLAACQQARVQRVVYAAQDPKGGALSLGYSMHEDVRTNHRFEVEY